MNKRMLLLAGTGLVLSLAAIPTGAQAILPVTDALSIAQRAIQAARQLSELVTQYEMMKAQYEAIAHFNNTLGVARGLLGSGMQLPGSLPTQIPGLAYGSNLSSYGGQFFSQNHYYTPSGTDFAAAEMVRQEQATANIQGEAYIGMQRASQRLTLLQQLQSSVDGQPDLDAVTSAEAHIASEHTFLSNEGNNIARLQLMGQMADRVDAERAEEKGTRDAEEYHELAAAEAFGP